MVNTVFQAHANTVFRRVIRRSARQAVSCDDTERFSTAVASTSDSDMALSAADAAKASAALMGFSMVSEPASGCAGRRHPQDAADHHFGVRIQADGIVHQLRGHKRSAAGRPIA